MDSSLGSGSGGQLAKASGNVVFGFFALGLEKHLLGGAKFNQIAQLHVRGEIAAAGGLLHIVGHNDYRVVIFQLDDQFFDFAGGDRV